MGMSQVPEEVRSQLHSWVSARRAVAVAQKLASEQPNNAPLASRLDLAKQNAKDAGLVLKAAMSAHGLSPDIVQAALRESAAN